MASPLDAKATVGNIRDYHAHTRTAAELARLRGQMGLGESLGPLDEAHGGTGGERLYGSWLLDVLLRRKTLEMVSVRTIGPKVTFGSEYSVVATIAQGTTRFVPLVGTVTVSGTDEGPTAFLDCGARTVDEEGTVTDHRSSIPLGSATFGVTGGVRITHIRKADSDSDEPRWRASFSWGSSRRLVIGSATFEVDPEGAMHADADFIACLDWDNASSNFSAQPPLQLEDGSWLAVASGSPGSSASLISLTAICATPEGALTQGVDVRYGSGVPAFFPVALDDGPAWVQSGFGKDALARVLKVDPAGLDITMTEGKEHYRLPFYWFSPKRTHEKPMDSSYKTGPLGTACTKMGYIGRWMVEELDRFGYPVAERCALELYDPILAGSVWSELTRVETEDGGAMVAQRATSSYSYLDVCLIAFDARGIACGQLLAVSASSNDVVKMFGSPAPADQFESFYYLTDSTAINEDGSVTQGRWSNFDYMEKTFRIVDVTEQEGE